MTATTRPRRRPLEIEPPREAMLRAVDLDFAYGKLQVLFGISLEVHRGEALALLGPNGAGKTTLLRVIAGLEQASAGQVTFDGQDITGVSAEVVAGQGLVFIPGERANFTDMTVDENLQMQALSVRDRRPWLRERQELVLETFPRLSERLSQQAGSLSGGEQKQLSLAKALLTDPKLLCVDELSLGLAPVIVGELLDVLQRIHQSGVTVILVEQSIDFAAQVCERTVFLDKGEVTFEGRTADLLERDDIARAVLLGE